MKAKNCPKNLEASEFNNAVPQPFFRRCIPNGIPTPPLQYRKKRAHINYPVKGAVKGLPFPSGLPASYPQSFSLHWHRVSICLTSANPRIPSLSVLPRCGSRTRAVRRSSRRSCGNSDSGNRGICYLRGNCWRSVHLPHRTDHRRRDGGGRSGQWEHNHSGCPDWLCLQHHSECHRERDKWRLLRRRRKQDQSRNRPRIEF